MILRADKSRRTQIDGQAGTIECLVEEVSNGIGETFGVICHPHPLYGGSMDNKVVHTISRALHRLGISTVRFNFRGVGLTQGSHDEGRGETDDAVAVVDWAREQLGGQALWLAGFSFGAWIAVRTAAHRECAQLITVAPPVRRFAITEETQPQCPWLIVHGSADELVDCDAVIEWVNSLQPGPELVVLPDEDHFFHGAQSLLRDTLVQNLSPGSANAAPV